MNLVKFPFKSAYMAQTHWYHFQSTLVWKIPEGGKVVSCSSITRNSQSWARIEGETGPGMRHQESFEQFLSAPSFTWHEYVVLTVRVFLWCLGVILWQNVWLFSWWKLLEFAFPPPPCTCSHGGVHHTASSQTSAVTFGQDSQSSWSPPPTISVEIGKEHVYIKII